jgi:hypothetical protein
MREQRPGIVCALQTEASLLGAGRLRPGEVVQVGSNAICVLAGVGGGNAGAGAMKLIDCGATCLVSWGFAGSLCASVEPGDLVLPKAVRDACGAIRFDVDEALWQAARALFDPGTVPYEGDLISVSEIVRSVGAKRNLYAALRSEVVDMESGAIMRTAGECGLPGVVIRAVVDAHDVAIPDYIGTDAGPGAVVRGLLGRPSSIRDVVRLAVGYHRASAALTDMARRLTG